MNFEKNEFMLREVVSNSLVQLAKQDSRVVVLDSDLANASGLSAFAKKMPKQFINCGIQEQNMVGVAGGLSSMGQIPVVHSFAAFLSRRVADQVFMSGVYSRQNIKMLASDPGALNAANGGTHMALEDIGIMRSMPEITIVDITDACMMEELLPKLILNPGMCYIRVYRKTQAQVYTSGTKFEIGKAHYAKNGTDITIIAEGALMVPEALIAAENLSKRGISAAVLDMFTIKPLDKTAVLAAVKETGAILTAENHNINNGLGSAVAEVLAENGIGIPFARIGFLDVFGETASLAYIMDRYKLSAKHIEEKAIELVAKK